VLALSSTDEHSDFILISDILIIRGIIADLIDV
jgi:hypothetical protein